MRQALMCLSILVVTNMATASEIIWNTKKISYQNEATTQAMVSHIKATVEKRCESLGEGETIIVASEQITGQYMSGQNYAFIPDNHEECFQNEHCSGKTIQTSPGYVLRESHIKLIRSNGEKSYEISVESYWDHDLPMPMATSDIKSEKCN